MKGKLILGILLFLSMNASALTIVNHGTCDAEIWEWLPTGDVYTATVAACGGTLEVDSSIDAMWRAMQSPMDWNNIVYDVHYTDYGNGVWNIYPTYCGGAACPTPDPEPTECCELVCPANVTLTCADGANAADPNNTGTATMNCEEPDFIVRTISNTANCNNGIDYSTWLGNLIPNAPSKYYEIVSGEFIEYADGTALIMMEVVNILDNNLGFMVEAELGGRTFTAPVDSPKEGCVGPQDTSDWYYYTTLTGTFSGIGGFNGAQFIINSTGAAPQMGTGGSLGNTNIFGFSSWFSIMTVLQPDDTNYVLDETILHGDFNIHLTGDPLTSDGIACGTTAGDYDITYSDSGTIDCNGAITRTWTASPTIAGLETQTCTQTISANIGLDNVTANNDGPITCDDSDSQLSATGLPMGATISWSGPGGYTSTDMSPVVTTPGQYTLTVTCPLGCSETYMTMVGFEECAGPYDLALIKEISDAQDQNAVLSEGDDVIFTITVCNQGEQASGDFTVVDQIPVGMTYVSDDNGGSYDMAANTITWNLSGLAISTCMSMDFTLNILTTPDKGYYRNFAEITSDSGDDEDSTPDTNTGSDNGEDITDPNDLFDNHNDSTQDTADDDEDDHDYEDIFVFGSAFFEGRVALQGAAQNSPTFEMRADLTNDDMMPMVEPYDAMPEFQHFGGGGGETCPEELLAVTGPDQIVDWLFMELRAANNPANVIATCSVLLQADGDIMLPNGSEIIAFDVPAANYYVAVRHRNHLGIMTADPITFDGTALPMIDFTDPATPTWGTDAQTNMGGMMAMWAGNADSAGGVVFQGSGNDLNPVFFDVLTAPTNIGIQTNFIFQEYVEGDLDMNCKAVFQGTANDPNVIFFNILTHPGNSSNDLNFIITEQLPE